MSTPSRSQLLVSSTDAQSPMMRLWSRFSASHGERWQKLFANSKQVADWCETWADGIAENQLTNAELAVGMAACCKSRYCPSLHDFLVASRPTIDPETAYTHAVEQMHARYATGTDCWPDPAVFWAACEVGSYDLMRYSYRDIQARWDGALAAARKQVIRPVPPIIHGQIEEKREPVSPEKQAENMARLKSVLGDLMGGVDVSQKTAESDITASQCNADFLRKQGINPNCVGRN